LPAIITFDFPWQLLSEAKFFSKKIEAMAALLV
jgi:hypothetical protein